MSSKSIGEYIGNCKFCKDDLSLDFISCFKTSSEKDFYFCSLGHYWTVGDLSEQQQGSEDISDQQQTSESNEQLHSENIPSHTDRPFNRDKPFNRDRPFNRDKPEEFYKKFTSNKKAKKKDKKPNNL